MSPALVFICVNGIMNNPGDNDGWTDRAVTWLNLQTPGKAEKFEYACDIVFRRLRQAARVDAIARMADFYTRGRFEIVFIGHSNGCDIIERVLAKKVFDVRSVHFFSPASDGDALAAALQRGYLRKAHLYGSANDHALQAAHLSRMLLGWAGLGYGDLGRRLHAFALEHPTVDVHEDDTATHSSWFERGERFERTMQLLLANEFPAPGAAFEKLP